MSLLSEHIDKTPEDAKRLLGIDYQSSQPLTEKAEAKIKPELRGCLGSQRVMQKSRE